MQGFETIINSIIKLGIAMLVGFVCIKSDASDTHYNFAYKP